LFVYLSVLINKNKNMDFNREKFPLITKKLYERDKQNLVGYCGGIYGVFLKPGYYDINIPPLQYIGESQNMYYRCHTDHQKPSQPLAAKLVFKIKGKTQWDYIKEGGGYKEFTNVWKNEILPTIEYRVIYPIEDSGQRTLLESQLIKIHKPDLNHNLGNIRWIDLEIEEASSGKSYSQMQQESITISSLLR